MKEPKSQIRKWNSRGTTNPRGFIQTAKEYATEQIGNAAGEAVFKATGSNKLRQGAKEFARSAASSAIDTSTSALKNKFRGDGIGTVLKNNPNNTNGTSGGGGGYGGGINMQGRMGPVLVSIKDDVQVPYVFKFNTGIENTLYGKTWLNATEDHSPLHLTLIDFSFPTNETTQLKLIDFIDGNISKYLRTAVQGAISPSVPADLLTGAAITAGINAICFALNTYFFFKSILAYAQKPENTNEGMLKLADSIDANCIDRLSRLERYLQGTPLPPNLVDFLFYLNTTNCMTELPGAPIIKFVTIPLDYNGFTTLALGPNVINDAIANLNANQEFFNLLIRATNWVKPDLPGYGPSIQYDPNFATLWRNSPFCTDFDQYPSVSDANSDENITYNSYTNELDGAIQAISCVYDDSTNDWLPGLMKPRPFAYDPNNVNITSNRFSWYSFTNGKNFVDANRNLKLTTTRGETFTFEHPEGMNFIDSIPAQGLTVNSITNTSEQLISWLISAHTIGKIDDRRIYPNTVSNKVNYK